MPESIVVYVNDKPVKIYQGMQVKHALISYDYSLYKFCENGELIVLDENGFEVGLEGALHEGAKIYTKKVKEG
ncbi:MAG: hypothetical protein ACPLKX_02720 [Dictyoglomaceae bacterium]